MSFECCRFTYWFHVFYYIFFFWADPSFETFCITTGRNINQFIYCCYKWLEIIVAIPRRFLILVQHVLCCLGLYILLGAILLGLCLLIRTYCTQISSFLDFIFVSGGGGVFPMFSKTANSATLMWNQLAPTVSLGLSSVIEWEVSIYEQLVAEYGEYQVETMIFNIINQTGDYVQFIGQWFWSLWTQQNIIPMDQSLLPQLIQWQMGGGLVTLLPLLQASQSLINPNGIDNTLTTTPFTTQRKLLDFDPLTQSPSYDYTAVNFVQSLQQNTRNLWSSTYGINGPDYNLNSSIHLAQELLKLYKHFPIHNDKQFHGNIANQERLKQLAISENVWSIFQSNTVYYVRRYLEQINIISNNTVSPINGAQTAGITAKVVSFNKNFRRKYGTGRAFMYSIDIHDILGLQNTGFKQQNEDRLTFAQYLQIHDITPKQVVELQKQAELEGFDYKSSVGKPSNPTQRNLLQVIPPLFPPILDCFFSIPPDPLCIIQGLLPLPEPTNPFIDILLDFDCDCTDVGYVDTPILNYFTADGLHNAILVIQTGLQAFFAIPPIFTFFDTILPDWLNQWFFGAVIPQSLWDALLLNGASSLGDLPDDHEIICAILNLDYFLVLIFCGFIAFFVFQAIICALWDIYMALFDLSVRSEHNELVQEIIISRMKSYDFDEVLKSEMKYTLFNPQMRFFNDPDYLNHHPSIGMIGASIGEEVDSSFNLIGEPISESNDKELISKKHEKLCKEFTEKAVDKVYPKSKFSKKQRKQQRERLYRLFYPEIILMKEFALKHGFSPAEPTDVPLKLWIIECNSWLGEPLNLQTISPKLTEIALKDASTYLFLDNIRASL